MNNNRESLSKAHVASDGTFFLNVQTAADSAQDTSECRRDGDGGSRGLHRQP